MPRSSRDLQYSSQIVETGAIYLEFSPNFLHSRFTPLFSLKCAALLPQCWAERIFEYWNECKPKSTLGREKSSVSRFVTRTVAVWIMRAFVKEWRPFLCFPILMSRIRVIKSRCNNYMSHLLLMTTRENSPFPIFLPSFRTVFSSIKASVSCTSCLSAVLR